MEIIVHNDPADIVATWNACWANGYVKVLLGPDGNLHALPLNWEVHVQRSNGFIA